MIIDKFKSELDKGEKPYVAVSHYGEPIGFGVGGVHITKNHVGFFVGGRFSPYTEISEEEYEEIKAIL